MREIENLFAAALAHHQAGRLAEAGDLYRRILTADPQQVVVWNHLGLAALSTGSIARALRLAPTLVEGHCNLAAAWRAGGQATKAIESLRRAVILQPTLAAPLNNLGALERERGRNDRALSLFRRACALAPGHPDIHCNLAAALLQSGNYEEGWREHEWRLHPGALRDVSRAFDAPLWQGEPLAGRTLLLHGEQGYGDNLQFVRFAALLAARGARVVVETPRPLARLLATAPGVSAVVALGDRVPPVDCHLAMMSAPERLGITLETLPAAMPYLAAPAAEKAAWKARAAGWPGRKVGLAWAGNPAIKLPWAQIGNKLRSIPLDAFAPLFALPGVRWVSLQKDGSPAAPPLLDVMGEMRDFADTAALIEALDLVITVDTAVAHLAGALNKPVWILSRFDGCWRWLGHRPDSPWYPTARLFHQKKLGDWAPVIAELVHELRKTI
jgi:tetratricopeptide (TPR) repeat protein